MGIPRSFDGSTGSGVCSSYLLPLPAEGKVSSMSLRVLATFVLKKLIGMESMAPMSFADESKP